jgi:hypothetical protein
MILWVKCWRGGLEGRRGVVQASGVMVVGGITQHQPIQSERQWVLKYQQWVQKCQQLVHTDEQQSEDTQGHTHLSHPNFRARSLGLREPIKTSKVQGGLRVKGAGVYKCVGSHVEEENKCAGMCMVHIAL